MVLNYITELWEDDYGIDGGLDNGVYLAQKMDYPISMSSPNIHFTWNEPVDF